MKLIEISNETLKDHPDIYYKNVQFFMFAEGGAMGEPGEIRFITEKDGEIRAYHTNYTYGEFDVRNIDVIFPALKDFRIDILGHSEGDNPYFYYVRLGMGNHLFVRKRLQKQFDGTFKDVTSPGEVYQRWFDTAIHLLETEGNQQ